MDEPMPGRSPELPAAHVPSLGRCLLPRELTVFAGTPTSLEAHDARESPKDLHRRLASGTGLVLAGPYAYVDAVYRYCQHFERRLVAREELARVDDRARRSAGFAEMRRQRLHRLLVLARGNSLVDVQDAPDTDGLQDWLEVQTGGEPFLLPVRRYQRILADMRRAEDGIYMDCLGGAITILPHVYVPADQSVPAMFADHGDLLAGKRVLDMGTGTGVLALLAARLGAASVIATDSNPRAVEAARLNVKRFAMEGVVQVRGPADLFASVAEGKFDAILFNAPWIQGEPETLYDTANYDPGFRVIDGFVRSAPVYLARGGTILLQYSDVSQRTGDGSLDHLHRVMSASGLVVADERSIARVGRVMETRERVFLFDVRRIGSG